MLRAVQSASDRLLRPGQCRRGLVASTLASRFSSLFWIGTPLHAQPQESEYHCPFANGVAHNPAQDTFVVGIPIHSLKILGHSMGGARRMAPSHLGNSHMPLRVAAS